MSDFALDDLDRARFDWPEPVLIDLIVESYSGAPHVSDPEAAARLHTRFLCELIDGETRETAFLRLELIACCAARGIGTAAIEAADRAAFRELVRVVEGRFRNSPRLKRHFTQRLYDALCRLPGRSEPRKQAADVQILAAARSHAGRVPVQIGRKMAV